MLLLERIKRLFGYHAKLNKEERWTLVETLFRMISSDKNVDIMSLAQIVAFLLWDLYRFEGFLKFRGFIIFRWFNRNLPSNGLPRIHCLEIYGRPEYPRAGLPSLRASRRPGRCANAHQAVGHQIHPARHHGLSAVPTSRAIWPVPERHCLLHGTVVDVRSTRTGGTGLRSFWCWMGKIRSFWTIDAYFWLRFKLCLFLVYYCIHVI